MVTSHKLASGRDAAYGIADENSYRQNCSAACRRCARDQRGRATARPYRERPDAYENDSRNRDRGDRNQAGAFDYYVLALSWSPTYCAERRGNGYEPQCDVRSGRPYAFVLHGLWPQHERGWPENCRTSDRGWVPGPVAERMLDIMPSKRLVFNEYRKHGTCSGLGVDGYFDLARQPPRQGEDPAALRAGCRRPPAREPGRAGR